MLRNLRIISIVLTGGHIFISRPDFTPVFFMPVFRGKINKLKFHYKYKICVEFTIINIVLYLSIIEG
ncbi:hypothetical protein EV210_1231 [Anaerospora hongkongensis]|uniref:Uncharacterized protein n=1 Tax=Anaerospora hongkongensis TaxID=244830 RepID=A0A4R1PVQ1_9FIRM|nr:hypothetical protein EV210_1231 [Anaerospora hongkongensis]